MSRGQPRKELRNSIICQVRMLFSLSFEDIGIIFNIDKSRISRIISMNMGKYSQEINNKIILSLNSKYDGDIVNKNKLTRYIRNNLIYELDSICNVDEAMNIPRKKARDIINKHSDSFSKVENKILIIKIQ